VCACPEADPKKVAALRRVLAQTDLFARFDAVTMEHELRSYLANWPSLAQRHPAQTRQLLPTRIRLWRKVVVEEKHYHFQGEAAVGRVFNGLVGVKRSGVPNGI
jgi:hypothetical protein